MNDTQVNAGPPQASIPIISPVLHCVAMSVVIYLRSSFGFSYLRPKSIFLALSWASILFFIFVWNEPAIRRNFWAVSLFALGAALLYLANFLFSWIREWKGKGEHDFYSGKSIFNRISGLTGHRISERTEMNFHLWAEPFVVLIASGAFRILFNETRLSTWLFFAAVCLWLKEAINCWNTIRRPKRHSDIREDIEKSAIDTAELNSPSPESPKPTRKEKVIRTRTRANAETDPQERRFAETLRLMPPYSLDEAEQNYRRLIKANHPDPNGDNTENNSASTELNEAIAYFRARSQPTSREAGV